MEQINPDKKVFQEEQVILKSKPSLQCSDCGSTFSSQSNLKLHIEAIHEKKKPWLCSECGDSFSTQNNLKRHISTVHKGEKPFSCSLCYRSFSGKRHLKKHIQEVHEQIKPYQCPYCEKKCSRKPQVVQHVQAKHKIKITEEDIIQIKEIIEVADNDKDWVQQTNIVNGDNFTEEDLDENEERNHCTLCEATFVAKSSLRSHLKLVSKELYHLAAI